MRLGRRLLFATTDTRTLSAGLVGLTGLLAYSLAYGEPTGIVYPWNAAPPEAVPSTTVVVDGATPVPVAEAVAAPETRTSAPGAAPAATRAVAERGPSQPAGAGRVDPSPTPREAPASPATVSVQSVTTAVETAERAIGAGDAEAAEAAAVLATTALAQVDAMLASGATPSDGDPPELRRRLEAVRDGVALRRLEDDIGPFIEEARVAQEGGDYATAIALLRSLEVRADGAPGSRRDDMRRLLSLFRVSQTIEELVKACEFEREFLGRTEPCERR